MFPSHLQRRAATTLRRERNRELLDRCIRFGNSHLRSAKVGGVLVAERAPLLGGLVDDQLPGVLLGYGEKGVDALGNLEAVDVEIGIGVDRRGLICAGALHLPIGLMVADHFASAQVGPAISDGDFVTTYYGSMEVDSCGLLRGSCAGANVVSARISRPALAVSRTFCIPLL